MIIGTAGHIDHGKTALVKALTGVDTDRLPEEKTRGITIDIGFAHADWDGMEVSFIDVPGHERFIKNMLAGIGGIDLLMLVVAADESIMPQTREHFHICRLLQISSGVVVITKKDLVEEDTLALVRLEVSEFVKGSFLEKAPVYAVSAKTGEEIEELKLGLIRQLQRIQPRKPGGVFRLPIDRVFILKGHGTILTGTLISGRIRKDNFAEILPLRRRVKVRSIHAHDKNVLEAFAGQRTALNVQGIEKDEVERGDVLTEAEFLQSTSLLDTRITVLQDARPVVHNSIVRFHHLTNDVLARVTLPGKERLAPGESGFAQLRLQKPVSAVYGDRFILRKHSPLITIGGGLVLDHMPLRRATRGDQQSAERMRRLESATAEIRLAMSVAEKKEVGASEKYLKAKLALTPEEILRVVSDETVVLRKQPLLAMAKEAERTILQKMVVAIESHHQKNPLLPGIPKEELHTRFLPTVPSDVFEAILERAVTAQRLQTEKDIISAFGRRITLSSKEELLLSHVEELMLQTGLAFPGFEELGRQLQEIPEDIKKILYLLLRQQKVLKVTEDYFLHKKVWEELKMKIRGLKSSKRTFSVADFKALFGISRKYAIPLLEQLDREGVTRRNANERIIL